MVLKCIFEMKMGGFIKGMGDSAGGTTISGKAFKIACR
jgi:hypothetical protein